MKTANRPPEAELRRRIHVGCGPKALKPHWWNIDVRFFPGVDEVKDVTEPWSGFTGVTHVYGEHFLEHLTLDQAVAFLENAHGALKAKGRLRLSTPSLEWVHTTHFDAGRDAATILNQTFTINRAFHGWGHRFLWSKPMIDMVLDAMGYIDVTYHDYGESYDPVLAGLEQHGGYRIDHGFPSVWIVEASPGPASTLARETLRDKLEDEFGRYVSSGH